MISRDKSAFDPASAVSARWRDFASQGIELTVLIATSSVHYRQEPGIAIHGVGGGRFGRWHRLLSIAKRYAHHTDLITAQDSNELAWIAYLAAKHAQKPFEIQDHGGIFAARTIEGGGLWYKQPLAWFFAKRATAIRTVNPNAYQVLAENGYTQKSYFLPISANPRFAELDHHPDPDMIVSVSRLIPIKRIPLLLESFALILKERPNAKLAIIGDGPERKTLEVHAHALGIRASVTFAGQTDPAPWLARASCFALLSAQEGWGVAAIEAAMAGVPVVMSNTGCAPWLQEKQAALIVPEENPALVANAITSILDHSKKTKTLTKKDIQEYQAQTEKQVSQWKTQQDKSKKKTLIIAQALDEADPFFGFFVPWVRAFLKHKPALIFALRVAKSLPDGIDAQVIKLRQRTSDSRLKILWTTFTSIFKFRHDYDSVFIRGDLIYLVLFGWLWKLLRKRTVFWYTHYKVANPLFWIACFWANEIVTATKEANPHPRALAIGHHIDTDVFVATKKSTTNAPRVLLYGRISPVKRVPWMIEQLVPFLDNISLTVVGTATDATERKLVAQKVAAHPEIDWQEKNITQEESKILFQSHDIVINATPGSLDKVILEAAASGCLVLAQTPAFQGGEAWQQFNNEQELAHAITRVIQFSDKEKQNLLKKQREWVEQEHALKPNVDRILGLLERTHQAVLTQSLPSLIYLTTARIPTEKANGIQIMEMCRAFSQQGFHVDLRIPTRKNTDSSQAFVYYGVEPTFSIQPVSTPDTVDQFGKLGFWWHRWLFVYRACKQLTPAQKKAALIYTRDEWIAIYAKCRGARAVYWEAHEGTSPRVFRWALHRIAGIICITNGVAITLKDRGAQTIPLHVSPDGVDLEAYQDLPTQSEARHQLGLSDKKKLVIYTGHLYPWKGVDTLAEAAAQLDPDTVEVICVGGTQEEVADYKQKFPHVQFVGHKPHNQMPLYQRAADLLTLPNSGKEEISNAYTSPLKLFEYMASGTPIIASDLPSLREILSEETAYFVAPDQVKRLAEKITQTLQDPDAQTKSQAAKKYVENYTWNQRAKQITRFIDRAT